MSPANSVEIAIWVAVGGRGSLMGPVLGAALVNGAKSWLTVTFPEIWLYVLGLVFIVVTRFMPHGIAGLLQRRGGPPGGPATPPGPAPPPPAAPRAPPGVKRPPPPPRGSGPGDR